MHKLGIFTSKGLDLVVTLWVRAFLIQNHLTTETKVTNFNKK